MTDTMQPDGSMLREEHCPVCGNYIAIRCILDEDQLEVIAEEFLAGQDCHH